MSNPEPGFGNLCRLGYRLVRLSASQGDWILRRTEHISFDDSFSLTRRSTLDISLTRLLWRSGRLGPVANLVDGRSRPTLAELPVQGNRILLPIGSFLRSDHYDVAVTTSSREELPFLPRTRERKLIAAGLAVKSLGQGAQRKDSVSKSDLFNRYTTIHQLLESDPPSGPEDDGIPSSAPPFIHELEGLKEFRRGYLIIATPTLREVFGTRAGWDFHPGLIRLTETHSEALLPAGQRRKRRRFAARTAEATLKEPDSALVWSASGSAPVAIPKNLAIWRMKRRSEDIAFAIPAQPTSCKSFHMHIAAPSGTYLDAAVLAVVAGPRVPRGTSGEKVIQIEDDDVHWDSSHLFFSRKLLSEDVVVRSEALIVLRPKFHGFVRPAMNLAALTIAIMIIYTFTIGWRATGWPGIQDRWLQQSNSDPVTALLLGALTIAIGVMIRPDEHDMTGFVAKVHRRLMAGIMISALAAATSISVGVNGLALFCILGGSSLVAGLFFLPLSVSAVYSRSRGNDKPRPRNPAVETMAPHP